VVTFDENRRSRGAFPPLSILSWHEAGIPRINDSRSAQRPSTFVYDASLELCGGNLRGGWLTNEPSPDS
jgi:hypothetical protein